MEDLLFREVATAVFLLLLGAARWRYAVASGALAASGDRPAAAWARQVPAYFTSTVWALYVAWLVLAPLEFIAWDQWAASAWLSHLLAWAAIPFFGAGLWLFWYSHNIIGQYWCIDVRLKEGHRLVTEGPYRYIRHPLYTALFLGYLGTVFALQSWALLAWLPAFVASYLLFAAEEENMMERGFGEAYRAYRRRTGMFLPRLARRR